METVPVVTVLLSLLALCQCVPADTRLPQTSAEYNRPIIGVIAQETPSFFPGSDTYIMATYVRYLQQSGARVVPVRAGEPLEYYIDLFYKLNGVVFPGGIVEISSSLYTRTARVFFDLALQAAQEGEHFPVWGVCLGLQMLALFSAGEDLREETDAENLTLPLDFTKGFRDSRLFSLAPEEIIKFLKEEPLAQNNHEYGILMDAYNNNNNTALKDFYRVLSTNTGRQGTRFISTMEAINYPFYGVQWHPEKIAYNWDPHFAISHSRHAVRVAQYFSNFFVDEARKSSHRFPSEEEATAALINNYNPVLFTNGSFFELYFFNLTDTTVKDLSQSPPGPESLPRTVIQPTDLPE